MCQNNVFALCNTLYTLTICDSPPILLYKTSLLLAWCFD